MTALINNRCQIRRSINQSETFRATFRSYAAIRRGHYDARECKLTTFLSLFALQIYPHLRFYLFIFPRTYTGVYTLNQNVREALITISPIRLEAGPRILAGRKKRRISLTFGTNGRTYPLIKLWSGPKESADRPVVNNK